MRLFKVFPNLGNNYNFTEARNRTVKQNKGKHESAAFSLRNQNNVCKVKLRQFKENSKKPNSGNTVKEVQATKSIR